jgi:hypothetical protein
MGSSPIASRRRATSTRTSSTKRPGGHEEPAHLPRSARSDERRAAAAHRDGATRTDGVVDGFPRDRSGCVATNGGHARRPRRRRRTHLGGGRKTPPPDGSRTPSRRSRTRRTGILGRLARTPSTPTFGARASSAEGAAVERGRGQTPRPLDSAIGARAPHEHRPRTWRCCRSAATRRPHGNLATEPPTRTRARQRGSHSWRHPARHRRTSATS